MGLWQDEKGEGAGTDGATEGGNGNGVGIGVASEGWHGSEGTVTGECSVWSLEGSQWMGRRICSMKQ